MSMSTEETLTLENPILDVIARRRSSRAYAPAPVTSKQIETLFESARWAPSSMNEQPWRYLYATTDKKVLWSGIFDTLNDSNKIWAKNAPLLVVSMAKKTFSINERPNPSAQYDLGGANAFLSLQATAMGLNVHQMGGYDHEALRHNLNIPDEFELGVVMAIGFPGDPENLPEALRQRERAPRNRRPQSAFVASQSF
jgi:nitroreductase